MKHVYCENCGMKLEITRKAIPKAARIIDLVEYHTCLDEPVEISFEETDIPRQTKEEGKDKFVQNLNDLVQNQLGSISTGDLTDMRDKETVKSIAPESVIKNLQVMQPSDIEALEED